MIGCNTYTRSLPIKLSHKMSSSNLDPNPNSSSTSAQLPKSNFVEPEFTFVDKTVLEDQHLGNSGPSEDRFEEEHSQLIVVPDDINSTCDLLPFLHLTRLVAVTKPLQVPMKKTKSDKDGNPEPLQINQALKDFFQDEHKTEDGRTKDPKAQQKATLLDEKLRSEYAYLVQNMKRERLDSMLGASMQQWDGSPRASGQTFSSVYNLSDKLYKEVDLEEAFALKDKESVVILLGSLKEPQIMRAIRSFDINPIIVWEIMIKSNCDKAVNFDQGTAYFSIDCQKEFHMSRKYTYKIIHQVLKNQLIVFTDEDGYQEFQEILLKSFKFASPPGEGSFTRALQKNLGPSEAEEVREVFATDERVPSKRSKEDKYDKFSSSSFSSASLEEHTSSDESNIRPLNHHATHMADAIDPSDVLFVLFDEALRKIEPIIVRFEREANALNSLSLNLSFNERLDFVRRSHMAKEMMLLFKQELQSKHILFRRLKTAKFVTPKLKMLIKFLDGRLYNSIITLRKVRGLIELSTDSYSNIVENGLHEHSNKLNIIMKAFASIATMFLPLQVVSGVFGMNMKVPWQDDDNYWAFFGVVGGMVLLMVALLTLFRGLKWL